MHPTGRICKLSPMTVLTSASHAKVTPRTAFLKKIFARLPVESVHPEIRVLRIAHTYIRSLFN